MTAHPLMLISVLVTISIGRSEAFSYHETNNVVKKSFEESDYSLGPEFNEYGMFAYLKVKKLIQIPPAIRVSLNIFDKSSTTVRQSFKKFVADPNSTNISVTSMKLDPIILTISETQKTGKTETTLVMWEPISYPDPDFYLPMNHTIITGQQTYFEVFMNDYTFCQTSNGICRIEFYNMIKGKSEKLKFFNGDLLWSNMHISYVRSSPGIYFISGMDPANNYKFLRCDTSGVHGSPGCDKLFSLSNAHCEVKHSSNRGICYIENPGKDKSVNCLAFDLEDHGGSGITFHKTVTYGQPMSLLHAKNTDSSEILLIAKRSNCLGSDCLNVIVNKVPADDAKMITYREVALECSNDENLFKIDINKKSSINALVIEYICEGNEEFIFKSVTIDDKLIHQV